MTNNYYKPLEMHLNDLSNVMRRFPGSVEGFYRVLEQEKAEAGERSLAVEEAIVHFYWDPSNKSASYISVVGSEDYGSVIKGGKVWEEVIKNIAEKNSVRLAVELLMKIDLCK